MRRCLVRKESSGDLMMPVRELGELMVVMSSRPFRLARTRERAKGEVRQTEGGVGTVFPSLSRRERHRGAPRACGRAMR
jgi:hypothetical protein